VVLVDETLVERHSFDLVELLGDASLGANIVLVASLPEGADPDPGGNEGDPIESGSSPREMPLQWGPLRMDMDRRLAWWHGKVIRFTPKQYRLMYALVRASGRVRSARDLHEEVFGDAYLGDGERIVSHVRRVRTLLEEDPSRPAFLLTVRGEGFRLADAVVLDGQLVTVDGANGA
jgi:DNA-binding response OmpR family regulator